MSAPASPNASIPPLRHARSGWIRGVGFGLCLLVGVCSPWTATLSNAAPPLRITVDPGHGGSQIGASYRFADGVVLQEKTLSLRIGLRLRQLLERAGYAVTLTRSSDTAVNTGGLDLNGDGRVGLADELQARIDLANRAGSDLFVSVCLNGSSDPSARGTEILWNPNRRFSDRSQLLAKLTQSRMVADLAAAGYTPRDRGIRTDAALLGGDALFLLGPASKTIARPSQMPAIIGETLFLTNPADATALRDDRIVEAIAHGYFDGIQAYVSSTARAVTPTAVPLKMVPQTRFRPLRHLSPPVQTP
ncbi:MAG: N-acetylmuramoyl-L-alanine amidase [Chloroflexota bacterium]|nr:N-acetylmuramoyl-L-alanine amidase [Chloroflexota bacterium]